MAVCTLRDGDELVGVYPLWRSGTTLTAWSNSETPAFRPAARDLDSLTELSDAVFAAARRIELPNLPAHEAAHAILHERVRAGGGVDHAATQKRSPVTDTSGDFDVYRAARKKDWRETERRSRKAAREH